MNPKPPSKSELELLRKEYPAGCRIELVEMDDPYTNLKPGDRGCVNRIDDMGTIFVKWDSGSGLGVAYGVDIIKHVEPASPADIKLDILDTIECAVTLAGYECLGSDTDDEDTLSFRRAGASETEPNYRIKIEAVDY